MVMVEQSHAPIWNQPQISANIGGEGGAIHSISGTLDVESSLFYNNTAHREGNPSGGGGAIAVSGGVVTLTNSTFVSNYSPFEGGAINNDGELTVTNCTFSYNTSNMGGAINNTSNLTLRNSIIANSMWSESCQDREGGTIYDGGGNLRWPKTDKTCVGEFGDPQLEPLADNGGPTMTMALPIGSAAVQLATTNCPATDQRGMPRGLQSNRCDAGAYELQGLFVFFPAVYKSP
jgi:hypothetical protein